MPSSPHDRPWGTGGHRVVVVTLVHPIREVTHSRTSDVLLVTVLLVVVALLCCSDRLEMPPVGVEHGGAPFVPVQILLLNPNQPRTVSKTQRI